MSFRNVRNEVKEKRKQPDNAGQRFLYIESQETALKTPLN